MSRNVVITGGAGGLGLVIGEAFMARGDRVHICDAASDFPQVPGADHDNWRTTTCDIGDAVAVEKFFAQVREWMPSIDVLVNNVGIAGPRASLEAVDEAEWEHVLGVNLLGAIRCIRNVLPGMKQARSGAVINISTSSVSTRPLNRSPYTVSKAALEALTLCLAREVGPYGVRCNAIRPGMMDNERLKKVLRRVASDTGRSFDETVQQELQYISMRCLVPMKAVANMVLHLSSTEAAQVTGQIVGVDGGAEWES